MAVVARRTQGSAVGNVGREAESVVDIHRDVDEIAAAGPVEERSEAQLPEGEIVAEAHCEIRRRISLLNFLEGATDGVGCDDLRHTFSNFEATDAITRSERNTLSGSIPLDVEEWNAGGK